MRGQCREFCAGRKLEAIRRRQRGAFALDAPFEFVAAARLFCRPGGRGAEQRQRNEK